MTHKRSRHSFFFVCVVVRCLLVWFFFFFFFLFFVFLLLFFLGGEVNHPFTPKSANGLGKVMNPCLFLLAIVTQSAWTAEYTDCIFAEGYDSPNVCPGYDTKQSDDEASIMLELWGKWSTPLLIPSPLRPRVVAPDRVLSIVQIELNCSTELFEIKLFWHLTVCKQKTVLMLNWIVWNRTVHTYKMNLALNNRQLLIYHKSKTNQTKPNSNYG